MDRRVDSEASEKRCWKLVTDSGCHSIGRRSTNGSERLKKIACMADKKGAWRRMIRPC